MRLVMSVLAGGCLAGVLSAQSGTVPAAPAAQWSGKAAAAYLDGRIAWWMDWKAAARDHETFCVSCHTAAPYAVGRPSLRGALGEAAPSALERRLVDNVTKRVRMWKEMAPFYPTKDEGDPKGPESRGTEAILNALVLTRYDQAAGKPGADSRLALNNMWAEQIKTGDTRGALPWLQFHNAPWEGDSQYYGAALAAVAAGSAPGYAGLPEASEGVKLLSEYLVREQGSQVPINRATLLWASAKLRGLLTREQQKSIIDEIMSRQQADGGFCLCTMVGGWKRHDNTPLEPRSDGYATGLVVYALEQAGVSNDEPGLKRGLEWLAANQQTEGNWPGWSLNKQRDPASDAGRFMSDAATAYAVLALTSQPPAGR
jgi:squalene-hopene/tetraprenyl-beta-curcumene cyclase